MEIVEIGNLITGIATLVVAIVLLFQLRKQNQQLDIQHKDTVGNVINQFSTRVENLDKLTINDPELNDLWIRGSRDWNNLKDDNERFRFRNLMRLYFQMAKDHFNLQKNGALPEDKVRNRIFPGALLNEKGKAYCFKQFFIGTFEYDEHKKIWFDVFLELWGEDLNKVEPIFFPPTKFK